MDRSSIPPHTPQRSIAERIADTVFAAIMGIAAAILLVHHLCR
jgi:hypothetical protein